jgi:hypothetical protein
MGDTGLAGSVSGCADNRQPGLNAGKATNPERPDHPKRYRQPKPFSPLAKGNIVKFITVGFVMILILTAIFVSPIHADVEWRIYHTMKLDAPPVDMAISANGNWIFSLTEGGSIDIRSPKGELVDKIEVGSHVDQIEAGPLENIVLLKSRRNQTIQVLIIDFNQPINV